VPGRWIVPEGVTPGESPLTPGVVDVLPVETVEPIVRRHEEELRSLRLELERALRDAEAAEQRLRVHRVAAVYDDAFEAKVLAHVERSVSDFEHAPRETTSAAVRTPWSPVDDPAVAAPQNPPTISTPVLDVPHHQPDSPSSPRPRTVVVDRSKPRTVVVDRGAGSAAASSPGSSARPSPAPASSARTATVGQVSPGSPIQPLVDADPGPSAPAGRGERERRRGRASKLPAHLLIQLGVAIVIVALLLLKVG